MLDREKMSKEELLGALAFTDANLALSASEYRLALTLEEEGLVRIWRTGVGTLLWCITDKGQAVAARWAER